MKNKILITLGLIASIGFNIFIYAKTLDLGANKETTLSTAEQVSVRLLSFKAKMEKADEFIHIVSGGKYSLEDTLVVKTSEGKSVAIWAKSFWGTQRPAVYEIAIQYNYGDVGKIVFPDKGTQDIQWEFQANGTRPDPSSEEFLYCFEGLLRTFCKQQGYELPVWTS